MIAAPAAALLLSACLGASIVVVAALRDRWVRWWFEMEDPRSIALYRIVFAFLLLCDVNGLWEWFGLLFTAEGLFTGAEARAAFAGDWSGDGAAAIAHNLTQGPFSLLYFVDTPAAFWTALVAFNCCAVLFMVGMWTRVTGLLSLVLFDTILCRNLVFWEGTELVFRVFLVYLVCARCGDAYGVDAWLRRRREARNSAPIPAWPRRLIMVQMAVLLATTGLMKHGGAWLEGDAVYYALTYDHFVRFRVEGGLAALGDGALAALTFLARSVEVFFPLALVGLVGRWSARTFAPLQGRRRLLVVVALLVGLTCSTLLVHATGAPRLLPTASREVAAASWVIALGGTWWLWARVRLRPLRRGAWRIDSEWLGRNLYGRRTWATGLALLMLGMWSLMNIGTFHPVMLATLIPFFDGREVAAALRWLCRRPRRDEPDLSQGGPLVYSPRVRAVGGVLLGWHLVAVAVAVLPATDETRAFRDGVGSLAGPWLRATRTGQSWGMWANPPHDNTFLKAVVIDATGAAWDLRTDLYALERRPPSPARYDRWWKIAERVAKSPDSAPYRGAYSRWLCRTWSGPAEPVTVELREVSYAIPTPQENRRARGFDSDDVLEHHATERLLSTHACDRSGAVSR